MILKWKYGSQQKEYKQKFNNETDSDSQVIQNSMAFIKLIITYNFINLSFLFFKICLTFFI